MGFSECRIAKVALRLHFAGPVCRGADKQQRLGRNPPALRDLEVEVRNGAAVITGQVSTFYQKQLATSCCQRVAGVLSVLNEVRVTDTPRMPATCEDGS